MRDIQISTDVFARIWSLRNEGEDTENTILTRVLWEIGRAQGLKQNLTSSEGSGGLRDRRFGVFFPEGFQIERIYHGQMYRAYVQKAHWCIEDISGRFSTLNELSRAIGTKTENAWVNWFFIDENGDRKQVSILRDPNKISARRNQSNSNYTYSTLDDAEKEMEITSKGRWCDDVREALKVLGGEAPLAKIYQKVRQIRQLADRSTPVSLEEVVRKELETRSSDSEAYIQSRGEDWFRIAAGKGSGIWALRE